METHLKAKFIKYEKVSGHIEYTAEINLGGNSKPFMIRDRYNSMRTYWLDMTEEYRNSIPSNFPPKKWFNNRTAEFLKARMEALQIFFNSLLNDPSLAASPLTSAYLQSKRLKKQTANNKHPKTNQLKENKKLNEPTQPKFKWKIDKAETLVDNERLRQTVEQVSKTFADSEESKEPINKEEVARRVLEYRKELNKEFSLVLNTLELPKGEGNELSLELIENEKELSQWLNDCMYTIDSIIKNKDSKVYPQDNDILYLMDF